MIKKFLQFLKAYDLHQVHNMLTIMFDPCFKSLQFVDNYVGCGDYICLAFKYDANVIIPFLTMILEVLNFTIQACAIIVGGLVARSSDFIEEDNNIFKKVLPCTCCWRIVFVQKVICNSCCMC